MIGENGRLGGYHATETAKTSPASASSRTPLNDACRSLPSLVQALNATSAARTGSTQRMPLVVTPETAGFSIRVPMRRRLSSVADFVENPVPTLPT